MVRDLHALQAPVLGGELFNGHFPVGLFGLMTGFHLGKKFAERFAQLLLCQLGAVDDESDNPLFHFFLHEKSPSFHGFAGRR